MWSTWGFFQLQRFTHAPPTREGMQCLLCRVNVLLYDMTQHIHNFQQVDKYDIKMLCLSRSFLFLRVTLLTQVAATAAMKYKNVYGNELQICSMDGMAQTGYTRTGYCVEAKDNKGSHHICIDLSSAQEGNFCDVTGQYDWCSSEDMPCQEDPSQETCVIQNWCVCQLTFASYIQSAGGCDQIQDIVCDSINLQAAGAYQKDEHYSFALECLAERCNLDINKLKFLAKWERPLIEPYVIAVVFVCLYASLVGGALVIIIRRKKSLRKVATVDENNLQ